MNWEMEMNVLISFKAEVTLGVLWWNEGGAVKGTLWLSYNVNDPSVRFILLYVFGCDDRL